MGAAAVAVIVLVLLAVAQRRPRWARPALIASRLIYGVWIVAGLAYFPAKAGWALRPVECEWTFDAALAVHSFSNVPHIILFAMFFPLTYAQLRGIRHALAWSAVACITMGFLVEIAQGISGVHHCRMRDLIPDATGILIGLLLVLAGRGAIAAWRSRKPVPS
ncbi:MAG TPA: VanZ family protein [Thermoanaerobaculia bacterium]